MPEPAAGELLALQAPDGLPELAGVSWRARVDERGLRRRDRRWTRWTIYHLLPPLATAAGMLVLSPLLAPMSAIALGFAWLIPSLYAAKGAGVLQEPRRPRTGAEPVAAAAQDRALGLLGDLVGHDARAVLSATGFTVERGAFGVWVVGPLGALLVRGPQGRRVQGWCVRATGDQLPRADRISHLLLALRADEAGFATVANLSFSGARWRVRRRLRPDARVALDAAVTLARRGPAPPRHGRACARDGSTAPAR
jgi:hypothetical protein